MGSEVKTNMGLAPSEIAAKASVALSKATKKNTLAGLNRSMLRDALAPMEAQISAALPKHLTGERVMQMVINAIDKNPAIKECTVSSIVGAMIQASILGFEPVDSLGQVYFVPYGDKLQLQIGYRGFIDLARRSGQIKMISAHVVRKGDQFEYEFGLNEKLIHKPSDTSDGEITYVYAVAHYKDGGYNFVVLTRAQVEKLRLRNASQRAMPSGAWKTDYDKMAMAKAIKQLATFMPMSNEMQSAVASDEAVIDFTEDTVNLNQDIFYPDPEEPDIIYDIPMIPGEAF